MTAPGARATISASGKFFLLVFPFKLAHRRHRVRFPLHGVFVCAILAITKQAQRSRALRFHGSFLILPDKGRSGYTPRNGSFYLRVFARKGPSQRGQEITRRESSRGRAWPCATLTACWTFRASRAPGSAAAHGTRSRAYRAALVPGTGSSAAGPAQVSDAAHVPR